MTALELIASTPVLVTLPPVVSTKAWVPLLTVPTATAPARLTLPPPVVLALLLVNWVCDCEVAPGVVAPPLVDLAKAVRVFWVSAAMVIAA